MNGNYAEPSEIMIGLIVWERLQLKLPPKLPKKQFCNKKLTDFIGLRLD
jgi:hypothetical protein